MPKSLFYRLPILLLTITLSACAPIDVVTQYDPGADFTKLKTYTYLVNQQKDDVDKLPMAKETLDRALENAFDTELTSKGFTNSSSNPDFLVSYYIVVKTVRDTLHLNRYYNNLGYNSYDQFGGNPYSVHIVEYQVGALVVDIIDTSSKETVWRGSATTPIGLYKEEEKQIERINTAVKKILKKFPR